MRSSHNNLVTATLAAALLSVATPAIAQVIETARDASTYCRYSETRYRESAAPKTGDEYNEAGASTSRQASQGADDEGYERARRKLVHRPLTVELDASQAPVIGYDRGTGILSINVYGEVPVVEGFGLRLPRTPTLDFELPEERAQELVTRYQAGGARLKVIFLPPAYAKYDLPLCEEHEGAQAKKPARKGASQSEPDESGEKAVEKDDDAAQTAPRIRRVIIGELLEAHMVGEEAEELASFQTRLGHEVEMMRNHRITGYLASALPSVDVSSLVLYGGPPNPKGHRGKGIDDELHDQLGDELQKVLFGCYVQGLRRNARLQGALVVQFTVGEAPQPRVLVDSIHHPQVVACTLERIARLAHDFGPRLDQPASLKATLIFKLQSPRERD